MSWQALTFVIVMAILALTLVILYHWPRQQNGKLMSIDEVEELMDSFPKPSKDEKGRAKKLIMLIIASIATLAIAITKHKADNPSDFGRDSRL